LKVLQVRHEPPWYGRELMLVRGSDDQVVMAGMVRINLDQCNEAVRAEILKADTPLGHILIKHQVMRRISPTAYLRIDPEAPLAVHFKIDQPTFGRLAIIFCDNQPAIELLEIIVPEPSIVQD
jgi:chorismate-pyruvate lyase